MNFNPKLHTRTNMQLTLQRLVLTDSSTCGQLMIDDSLECWTLELPVADGLPGSAIPAGTYPVFFKPSPKFESSNDPWVKQYAAFMPHIEYIPNRSLIMIHWGNYPDNTEGCVLVGKVHQPNMVGQSREAFQELYEKFKEANFEGITITVIDKP